MNWIPVDESLPNDQGVALVAYVYNSEPDIVWYDTAYYSVSETWRDRDGSEIPGTVTHWAYIDIPPKTPMLECPMCKDTFIARVMVGVSGQYGGDTKICPRCFERLFKAHLK